MLQDKERYAQGWRGQYPPFDYHKLNNKVREEDPFLMVPAIPKIVGTKLHHVSPIEKMGKEF
jgi:hypothetical protein